MRRDRPLADVLLVLVVLALASAPLAAASAPKQFTPSVLAGTWSGTWTNQTLGTTGSFVLRIRPDGRLLRITTSLDGCTQSFAPRWTPIGFTIASATAHLTYSYPSGSLSGSGGPPACASGGSWQLDGMFTARQFSATVYLAVPEGGSTTTVVTLARK